MGVWAVSSSWHCEYTVFIFLKDKNQELSWSCLYSLITCQESSVVSFCQKCLMRAAGRSASSLPVQLGTMICHCYF